VVTGHPNGDLTGHANNTWYHRTMAVPTALIGKTASRWSIVGENDTNSLSYSAQYDNIVVTDGSGNVRSGGTVFANSADYNSTLGDYVNSGGIASSAVSVVNIDSTKVNDDNASITYSGTWTDYNSRTGAYNNDDHYVDASGAYAQYTFTGTSIQYIAMKDTNLGKADIYIDNVFKETDDLYAATLNLQQVLYSKTDLSNASHTIKVQRNGTKNASSSGTWIDLDAFQYQ
jgi:hypothetical protein